MATRNIQMNILTDSGSYDTLYPQTTASQAGARPDTWMPSASQVGALPISGGTLTGDLKIKNSNNYGTTLSFGDGTYCQISEPVDDCMDIKAKKVNFTISDTSDNRFTINNVNPFGANGDLILEQGTRIGNGASYLTTTNGVELATFSKITNLLLFTYGLYKLNPYPMGHSDSSGAIMTDASGPALLHTFIRTNGGYTSAWQFRYYTGDNAYNGFATFHVSYDNKLVKAWIENNSPAYTPNRENDDNSNGVTYKWWAIGY